MPLFLLTIFSRTLPNHLIGPLLMAKASASKDASSSDATTNPAAKNPAATMAGSGHHYAIVVDGGRQYKVSEGQELEIDFRHVPPGTEIVFEEVLAVSKAGEITLGKPLVKGVTVTAKVLGLVQGDKLFVQKFRRRKNYRRRTGHRSIGTKIRIAGIA